MTILIIAGISADAQEQDLAFLYVSKFYNDSIYHPSTNNKYVASIVRNEFDNFNLQTVLREKQPVKKALGYTKQNRAIDLYYFPGTSNRRALVIGGVHGSELSSIEVAKQLLKQLASGNPPYFSVIVIPTLFPDNAALAEESRKDRISKNTGRYTSEAIADPNRQMPRLGQAFKFDEPVDAQERVIEYENTLLLQLIQAYAPERIISLHAIKNKDKGGIYADPRTDCDGRSLGFTADSSLAIQMATYIEENGGDARGNNLKGSPTALYYLDPRNAPIGEVQVRNLKGSNHSHLSHGVSLGGWAATAVCDEQNNYSRSAMRILTMEFPGYKKTSEHKSAEERKLYNKQVSLYAGSIYHYFIRNICVEDDTYLNGRSLAAN